VADYNEEMLGKLAEELEHFNRIQQDLETGREQHTHWPVLDAVSRIMLDQVSESLVAAVLNGPAGPAGLANEMQEVYQELVERIFWAGYQFRDQDLTLTECPSKHEDEQKADLN
jgi:hypothetical protein